MPGSVSGRRHHCGGYSPVSAFTDDSHGANARQTAEEEPGLSGTPYSISNDPTALGKGVPNWLLLVNGESQFPAWPG